MPGQTPEPADRPELTALERALRGLAPVAAALDRDSLLFRAGQAAAPRRWLWPAATAVSTTAALVLAVLLGSRPAPQIVERIVHVPVERPVPVVPPFPEDVPPGVDATAIPAPTPGRGAWAAHRLLEEQLLRRGLDGLGPPPPPLPSNPFLPPLSLSDGDATP